MFERVTTGAADDIQRAKDIARSMVTSYGMSTALGQINFEEPRKSFLEQVAQRRPYAEEAVAIIDDAVKGILAEGFARASNILEANRSLLDRAAARLLEDETLEQDTIRQILADAKMPDKAATPERRRAAAG